MEIERKFLIKEKEKNYYSPFLIDELKKEIKQKGKKIIQHYLPIELANEILDYFDFKITFKIGEIRLRKINEKCYITVKSAGSIKRHELEKRISKEDFQSYSELKTKTIEKIRLKKYLDKNKIEFDYFPKYSLITAEIEFESINQAEKFKSHMNEITAVDEYKNKNLAE
jgi:CYTH domain-containing protein